jgi:alkylation response protein AidB-like acyl-CoA dehydrogenase
MPQPFGKATRVEGGYEFEGRFQFASGAVFANWFVGGAVVEGAERPDGAAEMIAAVVPESQVERAGNWDVLGMRATESIDVVIPPTFVPLSRTTGLPTPAANGNLAWAEIRRNVPAVAAGPAGLGAIGHGGVVLGLARRALEEIATLAQTRRPMGGPPVADREVFRHDLVSHDAALRSVRALLYELVKRSRSGGADGIGDPQIFQALIHLHDVAGAAVEFAYRWAGTTALRGSNPLGRAMRDMHAATQHVAVDRQRLIDAAPEIMADLTGVRRSGDSDALIVGELAEAI